MKKKFVTALSVVMIALLVTLAACSGNDTGGQELPQGIPDVIPEITITMDDGNVIKAELYPNEAPNTVCNFLDLVNSGFYNGLTFHRVREGFMIQGGDAAGTGSGDPGFTINGEFASNGFTRNTLKHEEGYLSMARSGAADGATEEEIKEANNSAGTQFFIMDATATHLDNEYAAFGKVTEGLEYVHEYAARNVNDDDKPYDIPIIKTITADTKGAQFPAPIRNGEALTPEEIKNPTTSTPTTSEETTSDKTTTTTAVSTTEATTEATTAEEESTLSALDRTRMTATLTLTDGRKIVMMLYPEKAQNTVRNFVDLCNQKFYDGVIFHRVEQGFLIQTGGFKDTKTNADVNWNIYDEFNDLSYDEGVVGMALAINSDQSTIAHSAATQFFITASGNYKSSLDGKYTAFAKVIEGMDVVREISAMVKDTNGVPVNAPQIKTLRVDTKGQQIPTPDRNVIAGAES